MPWSLVLGLTLGLTALTTTQALARYRELNSGWSWDLGYYNQWFWAVALVPAAPLPWPLAWNDFRELQLAVPFVLWAVQGVRGRDARLAALGIGGMLACRQEFGLMVATFAALPVREPEDVGRTYR